MELCSICQRFDVHALIVAAVSSGVSGLESTVRAFGASLRAEVPRFFQLQPNLTALRHSSISCRLCNAVWKQYFLAADAGVEDDDRLQDAIGRQPIYIGVSEWSVRHDGTPKVAAVQYSQQGETRTLARFEVCAFRESIPSADAYWLGRSTAEYTGSRESLAVAKELLRDCEKNHARCRMVAPDILMPTRLLQIDEQHQIVRLFDTHAKRHDYMALSYCWGGSSTRTLTKVSEADLRAGLPISLLPATIRDALTIAQALRCSYIWIDALCVFQDSVEDWKVESVNMRNVYRGALLVIDAAAAATTDEGIFRTRPPRDTSCVLPWSTAKDEHVYLRPWSEVEALNQDTSHTVSRGWTMQEELLARRVLYMGRSLIALNCLNNDNDEAGRTLRIRWNEGAKALLHAKQRPYLTCVHRLLRALGVPAVITVPWLWIYGRDHPRGPRGKGLNRVLKLGTKGIHFQTWMPDEDFGDMTAYDVWRRIVVKYSERNLTYRSDVLPAISGVAEELYRSTTDTYLAGMWKGDLLRSLLWKSIGSSEIIRARTPLGTNEYVAPSWSWACVAGYPVSFPWRSEDPIRSKIRIIGASVETEGNNPFGRCLSGYLKVKGPTLKVCNPYEDVYDESLPTTSEYIIGKVQESSAYTAFDCESRLVHGSHSGQKFCLLHVCSSRAHPNFIRKYYLLLESTANGSWRRIGMIQTSKQLWWPPGYHAFSQDRMPKDLQRAVSQEKLYEELSEHAMWERRELRII